MDTIKKQNKFYRQGLTSPQNSLLSYIYLIQNSLRAGDDAGATQFTDQLLARHTIHDITYILTELSSNNNLLLISMNDISLKIKDVVINKIFFFPLSADILPQHLSTEF